MDISCGIIQNLQILSNKKDHIADYLLFLSSHAYIHRKVEKRLKRFREALIKNDKSKKLRFKELKTQYKQHYGRRLKEMKTDQPEGMKSFLITDLENTEAIQEYIHP